ncbi:hypothetical protein KUTeg_014588 [Tegillarca granosa]|uniref:Uncharacterized protein n=1 Tax=Tegillarca granosa TaxID=220873 RepID=A0ABQ9EWX5_TEGGR|nr:hypothetical protein KUTeg_014588 [Tegillarca granosa]
MEFKKRPPPHGITPVKGAIHIVVNRQFVEYLKTFLNGQNIFLFQMKLIFSSLNHNPQLKFPDRTQNWYTSSPCHGKSIRGICVFGVGDLPLLKEMPHLFTNKFHLTYQPIALDCMEEFHYNRTRDEYYNKFTFNTTFYEKLEFIKHVIK